MFRSFILLPPAKIVFCAYRPPRLEQNVTIYSFTKIEIGKGANFNLKNGEQVGVIMYFVFELDSSEYHNSPSYDCCVCCCRDDIVRPRSLGVPSTAINAHAPLDGLLDRQVLP